MNELELLVAAILGGMFRELVGLLKLPFTRREREAAAEVQDATALKLKADSVETLMRQNVEMGQQLLSTTGAFMNFMKDMNAEREMYRERLKKQDEDHANNIHALEQSLIESQEELKDTRERINNLSEIVRKISVDNEAKDKTIAEHNRTIDSLLARIRSLEDGEKLAKTEAHTKDGEIARLTKRVAELEAELKRLTTPAEPAPIEVLVAQIVEPAPAAPAPKDEGEKPEPEPDPPPPPKAPDSAPDPDKEDGEATIIVTLPNGGAAAA